MSNLFKWISLGFLGYRVYSLYAKKAAGAMDWDYKINSVGLTKYGTKFIEGYVDWEFMNATELEGQVRDIEAEFYYKGSRIGARAYGYAELLCVKALAIFYPIGH